MRPSRLVLSGLIYYWRTHLAVVLGVATAVAVLAGALLVGDSVRGSLRDLVLQRLGRTDLIVASAGFFRERLAAEIREDGAFDAHFTGIAPLIAAQGFVTGQESGRRAGQVRVYGVDERFWQFHGVAGVPGPNDRDALVSRALAEQLGSRDGSTVLVRVQRPTDVPLESLHARKDDLGRTLRLTVRAVLPAASLGDFSLDAQQGDVLALFVPLSRLQQELDARGRVNTLIVSAGPAAAGPGGTVGELERMVRGHTALEDLGLTVRTNDARRALDVGSEAGLLNEAQAAAAQEALAAGNMQGRPVFTYLANSIRFGDREIPYSLVAALDLRAIAPAANAPNGPNAPNDPNNPILLNAWAAAELRARAGDAVTMEYYVWEEPGQLATRTAAFRVAVVVPIAAGDRDLAPVYPGISDSPTLDDWDPPFPVDLRRIRPADEEYWKLHRTTPKAFVSLEVGQRLWRSRYGAMTSVRITPAAGQSLEDVRQEYTLRVRAAADPFAMGLAVRAVRAEAIEASRGATDFGAYFVYFSFFIVVSALLLAALFFKLGVEQRVREVGLLRAVGFGAPAVRRLFLAEGLLLSLAGSALGVLGALGYASLMMAGLRSWWVEAVGTTALSLHVSVTSILAGALGGMTAAVACIWWTLRSLDRVSERSLLAGETESQIPTSKSQIPNPNSHVPMRWLLFTSVVLAAIAVGLLAASATGRAAPAGAFFGAGSALLVASLCLVLVVFRRRPRSGIDGRGWQSVSRLGLRNATHRPGRSVLSMAVIASATFILISVDAFRRNDAVGTGRDSGVGGYLLLVNTLLPLVHDPNTREGREALNLFGLDESVTLEPFRLLPGDDASCLNLYEPRNPRILAPRDSFLAAGRFAFQESLAATDAERVNPWLILQREQPDGAVPVIADANSIAYVLHRRLGDDIVIARGDGEVRLRLVAALRDSIFQGELLMSQANFRRLFPQQEGYRVFLVDAPGAGIGDRESGTGDRASGIEDRDVRTADGSDQVAGGLQASGSNLAQRIEDALSDFGADAISTTERLAQFHRVENTYLSTFQTLGGLGLLLGTVGLATVLLRNVLERRRELALLGAVGYRGRHFVLMIVAENVLLLAGGLATGAICAGLAIAPAVAERGGRLPLSSSGALLLFAVFVTGLLSSAIAVSAATRAPLLASLRSE